MVKRQEPVAGHGGVGDQCRHQRIDAGRSRERDQRGRGDAHRGNHAAQREVQQHRDCGDQGREQEGIPGDRGRQQLGRQPRVESGAPEVQARRGTDLRRAARPAQGHRRGQEDQGLHRHLPPMQRPEHAAQPGQRQTQRSEHRHPARVDPVPRPGQPPDRGDGKPAEGARLRWREGPDGHRLPPHPFPVEAKVYGAREKPELQHAAEHTRDDAGHAHQPQPAQPPRRLDARLAGCQHVDRAVSGKQDHRDRRRAREHR